MFNDECDGELMREFVGLRAKLYMPLKWVTLNQKELKG